MNVRWVMSMSAIALMGTLCGCHGRDLASRADQVASVAGDRKGTRSAEIAPPEIKDFGFIGKLVKKGGDWMLTIQYGELLRGEAAHDAAVKDGVIHEEEELEDDYYVREGDHETG